MTVPVNLTFQEMDGTDALRNAVTRHATKLERFAPDIITCDVVVSPSEHRHHQGNHYHVRIRLTVPGGELHVGQSPGDLRSHQDAYVAISDAFRAMRRKLQDFRRIRQGKVKAHASPAPVE